MTTPYHLTAGAERGAHDGGHFLAGIDVAVDGLLQTLVMLEE